MGRLVETTSLVHDGGVNVLGRLVETTSLVYDGGGVLKRELKTESRQQM